MSDAAFLSKLRLVFHGTPDRNVEPILRLGILPSYRRADPECDWFAYWPHYSKRYAYCDESKTQGTRLLVFLILPVIKRAVCEDFGYEHRLGAITMKCASYHLPIGTVKLVQAPAAQT